LFAWEHEGKRYGHWTGSDVPGRLPPPSWRMRLERLAPPVPKQQFAEYVSRFARGRAALPGGGFRVQADQRSFKDIFENSHLKCESSDLKSQGSDLKKAQSKPALKGSLEEGQAQDWNWERNREEGRKGSPDGLTLNGKACATDNAPTCGETAQDRADLPQPLSSSSKSETGQTENHSAHVTAAGATPAYSDAVRTTTAYNPRDKSFLATRELIVGRGPSCGPVKVKPEALERIRARFAANAHRERNAARDGSRSP
jgi:hypothetical protein